MTLSGDKRNTIENSLTHYFDGSSLFEINKTQQTEFAEQFSVNKIKRYFADLYTLQETPAELNVDMYQRVVTVLWRSGRFLHKWYNKQYPNENEFHLGGNLLCNLQKLEFKQSFNMLQSYPLSDFTK